MKEPRSLRALYLIISLLLPALTRAQFNYTTNQGVVTITGYTGTNGDVTIPSTIVGLPVRTIASYAFYQKTILTSVAIPDSVTSIGSSAFYNCNRMSNVVMGTNVATISTSAFQGCYRLASIVIPNSVASMGPGVFYGCTNLSSVTISSNLATIQSSAFAQCSSLTSVTIPNGVKSIGSQAFYKCWNLLGVELSDTLTNIGSYAFQYCSSLTNVTLPNSVTSIGDFAFSLCTNLAHVTIGTNTASIGSYAFQQCVTLVNITIPGSVTNIGSFAFANCAKLTDIFVAPNNPAYLSAAGVLFNRSQTTLIQYPIGNAAQTYTIPSGVTNIADGAFEGCAGLVSVIIPDSVTLIPNNAFRGCTGLSSVTLPNNIKSIPTAAFYGCSSLASVTIPNSVTNIGDGAFQGCAGLTNVYIPYGVIRIPNNAFRGCAGLSSITIPSSVTDIGNSAFYSCSSLTNATTGNGVTNIEASAFFGCSNLASISMSYVLTTIGSEALRNCVSLNAIYFYGDPPLTVSTNAFIGVTAAVYYLPGAERWNTNFIGLPTMLRVPFTYATNNGAITITGCVDPFVAAITISNTIGGLPVVGIGEGAFHDFTELLSITIPDSVTNIGNNAFAGCTNLIDVYFWGNAPTVDLTAFSGDTRASISYRPGTTGWTSTFNGLQTALWIQFTHVVDNGKVRIEAPYFDSLTDVTIPQTIKGLPVTRLGLDAFQSSPITSITIPDSVTSFDTGVFVGCNNLTSVRLPNGFTTLSYWMFGYCTSLTSITIPASVDTVFVYAFYYTSLRTVYFQGNAPGIAYWQGSPPSQVFGASPAATVYYLPGTTGWTDFLSLVGVPGVQWDAQIQTSDGSFGVRTNEFGFNITGHSNLVIVVEASTDLSKPDWTRLQTNTLSDAPLYFGDPYWTNYGSRFYRVHWP